MKVLNAYHAHTRNLLERLGLMFFYVHPVPGPFDSRMKPLKVAPSVTPPPQSVCEPIHTERTHSNCEGLHICTRNTDDYLVVFSGWTRGNLNHRRNSTTLVVVPSNGALKCLYRGARARSYAGCGARVRISELFTCVSPCCAMTVGGVTPLAMLPVNK